MSKNVAEDDVSAEDDNEDDDENDDDSVNMCSKQRFTLLLRMKLSVYMKM